MNKATNLQPLIDLMATLRHPEKGCPWDLEQTQTSLVSMTFEEMSELADAIAKNDSQNTCEEIGDVLFHLVFYARLAEENGEYTMQDVIDVVHEKMTRRHPHIFAGKVYANEAEQKADWELIKQAEKANQTNQYPALAAKNNLDSLPAIPQGIDMQRELAKLGFDWSSPYDVFDKIEEEIDEVKVELAEKETCDDKKANAERINEEYGDLLFAVLNLGRKLDIDPDMSLRKANHKFYRRSEAMIALAGSVDNFSQLSLVEKESLWNTVKKQS